GTWDGRGAIVKKVKMRDDLEETKYMIRMIQMSGYHKNLVNFYRWETDGEFEFFAFEECGVTLHKYVKQHTYKEMSETTLKIMSAYISSLQLQGTNQEALDLFKKLGILSASQKRSAGPGGGVGEFDVGPGEILWLSVGVKSRICTVLRGDAMTKSYRVSGGRIYGNGLDGRANIHLTLSKFQWMILKDVVTYQNLEISDDEDPLPHDLADSDVEDLINDDDGVEKMADVARAHGGDGGGEDPSRPPPTSFGCAGCFHQRDRIRRGNPDEYTDDEWEKYINFWNDPATPRRSETRGLKSSKSTQWIDEGARGDGEAHHCRNQRRGPRRKLRRHIPAVGSVMPGYVRSRQIFSEKNLKSALQADFSPATCRWGKILPLWHQFLDQKIRGAHFSLGIVAGERFAIELTPSTFPQRHFAGDMFPQRHVAGEKVGMLLGKASNVVFCVSSMCDRSASFGSGVAAFFYVVSCWELLQLSQCPEHSSTSSLKSIQAEVSKLNSLTDELTPLRISPLMDYSLMMSFSLLLREYKAKAIRLIITIQLTT
ncbi:F-box domain containing protein, partial [Tanacetum coccineum]